MLSHRNSNCLVSPCPLNPSPASTPPTTAT
ncbi:hypothetical protein BN1708_012957, partial [Verticillium longisporum]